MLGGLGDADRKFSRVIFRPILKERQVDKVRIATRH